MSYVHEANGRTWEVEYGDGCEDCGGMGAWFEHTPDCRSDFCAGNGDEHSCNGDWLPCPGCGTYREIR